MCLGDRPGLAAQACNADILVAMDAGVPGADLDYRRGIRIALVRIDDPDTRLQPGDEGTVTGWDPAQGQLSVNWDSGSSLSIVPGEGDQVRVIDQTPISHPEEASAGNGGLVMVLRRHLGDFAVTRREAAGFVDCQGVKLVDVMVTAGQDVMVVVEGQQPVPGDLAGPVQKTVSVADLGIPEEWTVADG